MRRYAMLLITLLLSRPAFAQTLADMESADDQASSRCLKRVREAYEGFISQGILNGTMRYR